MTRTYRTPSAEVISVDTSAPDGEPYILVSTASIGSMDIQIVAGNRDQGSLIAEEAAVELRETYAVQGGNLLVGTRSDVDGATHIAHELRMGIWEGPYSSFKCFVYNQPTSSLLALVDGFEIADGAEGVLLLPKRTGWNWIESGRQATRFVQYVPGVGLVESTPIAGVARSLLPRWQGLEFSNTEIFSEESEVGRTYVALSPSALTRLYPERHGHPDSLLVEVFASFSFDWAMRLDSLREPERIQ